MMLFEDFWERYLNEDITNISDQVIEVFSSRIPVEIAQNYDLGEVATEFIGHHEDAKKFDKIAEFSKILKKNNREIYNEIHNYSNEALVNYYCFKKDFKI